MSDNKEIKDNDEYDDELDVEFEDNMIKKSPSDIAKSLKSFEEPGELDSGPQLDIKELEKLKKTMTGMTKKQFNKMIASMLINNKFIEHSSKKENLSSVSSDHRSDIAAKLKANIAQKSSNRKSKK